MKMTKDLSWMMNQFPPYPNIWKENTHIFCKRGGT